MGPICVRSKPDGIKLVLPEVLESAGSQFGIAHRVLNVLVAEIELNRARILGVREMKARCVPQHVRVTRPNGQTWEFRPC